MSAPEPRPWEVGPPRPAVGFPWTSHRTLWDVAHGHTPEPQAQRIPTRLLPPNPPTRK